MSDPAPGAAEVARPSEMNRRLCSLRELVRRVTAAGSTEECIEQFRQALGAEVGADGSEFTTEDPRAATEGSPLAAVARECRSLGHARAWYDAEHRRAFLLAPIPLQKGPPSVLCLTRGEAFTEDDQAIASLAASFLEAALRSQGALHALRESQALLHQSERMKSIGQLAGGVAHDFNNMLMVISAAAEVMSDTLSEEHSCRNHLSLIINTSHRAAELTQKLLAFSRKARIARKPTDVHEVLGAVREFLDHSLDRRITLHLALAAGPCMIEADSTQLQNALLNICLNARDAMPDGGRLEITTQRVDLDAEACERALLESKPGSYVRVEVRDTGTGMDEHTLKHAFDPFFTTKEPGRGTGLGLSVVFGAIREHGGAVSLDSRPGHGTSCVILLPLIERARPEASVLAPQSRPAGSLRILLLDDEPGVCRTAALLMRQLGHNVQALRSGEKALNHLRTHSSGYDLLVLDVVMPHPTGVEVHRALALEGIVLPTVFVSGYTEQHMLEGVSDDSGVVFLQKPFRQSELARAIARCMESAGVRPPPPAPSAGAWR